MNGATRLALGTVQFGLDYGATNSGGRVAEAEAAAILAAAKHAGIATLDTAPAYGDAEAVLGQLGAARQGFRIITKTRLCPGGQITEVGVADAEAGIARSQTLLGCRPLDGLLIHHGASLLRPGGARLLRCLETAKAQGRARRIGVSVYDPDELTRILACFTPDIVQLPLNIIDQRFVSGGLLHRLAQLGVEVHARSLFLQGTLLAETSALPARLAHLAIHVAHLDAYAGNHGLSRLEACLGFGLAQPQIGALIVGVTRASELAAIVAAVRVAPQRALPGGAELACDDPAVVNPSHWPRP